MGRRPREIVATHSRRLPSDSGKEGRSPDNNIGSLHVHSVELPLHHRYVTCELSYGTCMKRQMPSKGRVPRRAFSPRRSCLDAPDHQAPGYQKNASALARRSRPMVATGPLDQLESIQLDLEL